MKPDDIPIGVWQAAGQAKLSVHIHEAIARAIMAEREACAKAACDETKVYGWSGGWDGLLAYIQAREDAATAIRNRQ